MASEVYLRRHAHRLATILRRYGAESADPRLDPYDSGERAFTVSAALPGPAQPDAAEIRLAEVWRQVRPDDFRLDRYSYEFIERPLQRRRAFHRHDVPQFLEEYTVTVHEHCEEVLGQAVCEHHYGLPIDAYEAIHEFVVMWGQPGPLGCAERKCMD
jgi:hypothetical protein